MTLTAAQKYPTPPPEFFQANSPRKPAVISRGDILTVRFFYNPELNKTVKVRDDGKISLDFFQGLSVAGLTPEELQNKLTGMYSREFTKPEVTVDLDSQANNSVYVTGEFLSPGAKEFHARMTISMALAVGQVSSKTAGTKSAFLIRSSGDGKYLAYKLDVSFPNGTARDIELAPGDIIYVPKKRIAQIDDFIDQYVRQVLPGAPTTSLGVIYTPGNAVVTSTTSTHQ